jgi:thymidylate synthase
MLARFDCEKAIRISTHVGIFDTFADAWVECLRMVVRDGRDGFDEDRRLRELLNITLSAASCNYDDFVSAGADVDRMALMIRKYGAQSVLPEYRVSYGALFRDHMGVDQVSWLVRRLRSKPETKSATIGFHIPGGTELSCISLFDCKLRDQLLHVNAVFRSQNVFGSQPGNVLALSILQHELARELDVGVGTITLHILSAHIYADDLDAATIIAAPGCDRTRCGLAGPASAHA